MRTVIIIVSWQSGPHLEPTVASALAQAGPGDRVVVWDNASAGATQAALDALTQRFAELIVYRSAENLGFAGGNNAAAARHRDCDTILTLNPDAVLKPDALAEMRAVLSANPDVGAVGAVQLTPDERTIDGLGDVVHLSGLAWRTGHGRPTGDLAARLERMGPTSEIFAPCAAAALYRRSAFDAVGGFDEDYFCYCEDNDLGMRLRLAGWRSLRANRARVLHVGAISTGPDSDFSVYHGQRNLVWTFAKNLPAPLLVALLPVHLLMTGVVMAHYARAGRFGVILRAKRDALRGLPAALAKRRETQSGRRIGSWALLRQLDRSLLRR
ncbi:MAG: glycosyltransferase family 2 protein [Burkholderiaceae bacterium]